MQVEERSPVVVYTVDAGVAHIELDRPDVYNALDVPLARELQSALVRAKEDDTVGAVLLSGRGGAFCAGGDIKAMAASDDLPTYVNELVLASHRALDAIEALDKPIVAAVHGTAAGAGLGYVCAVDLVVADATAKFLSAFTAVGLTPDSSTSWHLPKVVGLHRAMELTLLNRVLTAQDALNWGLVNSVHDDGGALPAGLAIARRLAMGHRSALRGTRRLVRRAATHDLAEHLVAEADSIVAAANVSAVADALHQRTRTPPA